MTKTIFAAVLLIACLSGCQNSEAGKLASLPVLTADDLTRQFQKSRDELHGKYHGKEVIVLGEAALDFDPDPVTFTMEGKYQYFGVGAVTCKLERANADKFAGIKEDAVVAVKGVLQVNQGSIMLEPCTREFREAK